jgi:enoyl-CoA hydratase/long-chain 3-hydroxyacyl-CoA dehydrogenase
VIPNATTSDKVTAAAVDVGIRQGKTVIAVKDVPGFYVNRCLGPTIVETIAMLQQGADPLQLNKTMTNFGYPVGPVTLADEVGMDVATHVVHNLIGEKPKFLGERMGGADLSMMDECVKSGMLGRKSGKGFFDYTSKEKVKPINQAALDIIKKYQHPTLSVKGLSDHELAERIVLRFVSEAVHCLQSGVIDSARDGDIGAVFGVGFPPFLGGPFMYIDTLGAATVVGKMEKLQAQLGDHFAPPEMLLEHAATNKPFHSA